MIVTVTLNPCIDLNLEVEDLPLGSDDMAREARPLRALAQRKRPGGKGINVSAVLHILGVKSTAVVLLGGSGGEEFQRLAEETGNLSLRVVPAPGNTRTNIVITSRRDGRHLKVNQPGSEVNPEEIDRVRGTIDSLVSHGDALVLAGSLPPGAPTGTYADLIERFRSRGCWVALDSDGEAFREGLQARPHVLKPNREELGRIARFALDPESAILETAGRVVGEAPDTVCLVTDGPRPAYLVTAALRLRATPPPAHGSPTGSGDAFLAGFLKGLQPEPETPGVPSGKGARAPGSSSASAFAAAAADKERLCGAFRLAVACGAASASTPDTEYFDLEGLDSFLAKTEVEDLA